MNSTAPRSSTSDPPHAASAADTRRWTAAVAPRSSLPSSATGPEGASRRRAISRRFSPSTRTTRTRSMHSVIRAMPRPRRASGGGMPGDAPGRKGSPRSHTAALNRAPVRRITTRRRPEEECSTTFSQASATESSQANAPSGSASSTIDRATSAAARAPSASGVRSSTRSPFMRPCRPRGGCGRPSRRPRARARRGPPRRPAGRRAGTARRPGRPCLRPPPCRH